MSDFESLGRLFAPLLQVVLLVWKESKFYNTPGRNATAHAHRARTCTHGRMHACRLVVLMREICNDLIKQALAFTGGGKILEMEAPEAVHNLKITLKVCGRRPSVSDMCISTR